MADPSTGLDAAAGVDSRSVLAGAAAGLEVVDRAARGRPARHPPPNWSASAGAGCFTPVVAKECRLAGGGSRGAHWSDVGVQRLPDSWWCRNPGFGPDPAGQITPVFGTDGSESCPGHGCGRAGRDHRRGSGRPQSSAQQCLRAVAAAINARCTVTAGGITATDEGPIDSVSDSAAGLADDNTVTDPGPFCFAAVCGPADRGSEADTQAGAPGGAETCGRDRGGRVGGTTGERTRAEDRVQP